MEQNNEKLSFWTKLGYGLGDIYGGGASTIISFYYLLFLTDVVRLSPGLAGTVILISKIYDSITDPFEGVLSDRTRTPWGRRRPYLAAGVLLIFISFIALFYPVSAESEAARFAFVLATYLFYSTVVSIVMLNYNALQAELTLDYNERTALSSFRIFFSTASSIVCALVPMEIVNAMPDVRTGWMVMGVSIGLFFALPFIATVVIARERPEFQRPLQPFHWRQAFVDPFTVKTFVFVLVMYVTAFASFDATSSLVAYFVKTYLGRGSEVSYVLGTLLVMQVISLPFYVWLSRKTSKPRSYMVGAAGFAVVMIFSFLVTPSAPDPAVYILAAMLGLSSGGVVMMVYAIFPDIPDVDELRSGERREGIYSALTTFIRKLSSAIAIFAVAQVLNFGGYVAPLEQAGKLVEQPQSTTFIFALRSAFALLPIALIAFGVLFASRFPLTIELYRRMETVLNAQRAGQPVDETERQALIKKLIG